MLTIVNDACNIAKDVNTKYSTSVVCITLAVHGLEELFFQLCCCVSFGSREK
jgi:hypothetical protein